MRLPRGLAITLLVLAGIALTIAAGVFDLGWVAVLAVWILVTALGFFWVRALTRRRAAEEEAAALRALAAGDAAEPDSVAPEPPEPTRRLAMRPTRLLLGLGLFAFALTVALTVSTDAGRGALIAVWGPLLTFAAIDAALGRPGRLAAEVAGPREVFSGEAATLTLTLRRPDGGAARIGPALGRIRPAAGLRVATPARFERDGPGADPRAAVRVEAARRGVWPLAPLWLSWSGPLGLIEQTPRLPLDAAVRVIPNIRPISSGQIDLTVRSALYGVKENALIGDGSEFHQLRDWAPGMDTRSIDWKRSAGRRALLAKETRAERNHQVLLALDNGYTQREEVAGLPKIDHQVNAALACAWAAVLGGDRIGLLAFDARPRLYLPPESGRAAFARLRAATAELAYRSVESNHTLAMAHLHRKLRRRSLIVVFSDFADAAAAELLVENLAALNRAHLILFVTLKHAAAERIATARPESLTDVARAVSAAQMLRERRLVLERLARMGVRVIEAAPGRITGRLIAAYLEIKAREAI